MDMNKSVFAVVPASEDGVARIEILGPIGEDWWDDTRSNTVRTIGEKLAEVKALEAERVVVVINSLGGDVDQALAIYEVLRGLGECVETRMTGMCASAATVIAMAGKRRTMSRYGVMLIHQCSSWADGNEADLERELEMQRTVNQTMAALYSERTGLGIKEVEALMGENGGQGRWMMYGEALEKGFVTGAADEGGYRGSFTSRELRAAGLPMAPSWLTRVWRGSMGNNLSTIKKNVMNEEMNVVTTDEAAAAMTEQTPLPQNAEEVALPSAEAAQAAEEPDMPEEPETEPTAQADEVVQLRCRVERLEQLLSRAPAQTTAVSGDDTPMGESFEQQYMGLPYVQEACAELGLE